MYGRDPQCPLAEGTAVFPRDKDQVSRQNGDADEDQNGGMKVQPDQCRNTGQNAGNPADCPEQSEFAHLLYLFFFIKRSIRERIRHVTQREFPPQILTVLFQLV